MIWLSKTFPGDGWSHVQDQFEQQFMMAGGPRDMLLLFLDHRGFKIEIFVGLPVAQTHLRATYPDFAEVESPPKRLSLLVGHQDRFEEQFDFPVR